MAGDLAHDSSAGLFEILRKGGIGRELKMSKGETNGVGRHLLADLPAPHDNELGAGQFFQSHRTTGMNA